MNYWITTHWPPFKNEDVPTFVPEGIWLPDKREQAGRDIEIGDRLLIYQSKTGRSEIRNIKGNRVTLHKAQGKEGIIAIAKVIGDLEEVRGSKPTEYTNSDSIWWRWHAKTSPISMNGFVPRNIVNRTLGYHENYPMRGFGDLKSGLKKLDKIEYNALVQAFKELPRKLKLTNTAPNLQSFIPHDQGGESAEHKSLKDFVASNPSTILGEQGLKTIRVEYPFPPGDKADIVLEDIDGKIIGVEIEIKVDNNVHPGILQAIKYRYMLAWMEDRRNFETRSFLIAKSISRDVINLCKQYEVECFEIDQLNTTTR